MRILAAIAAALLVVMARPASADDVAANSKVDSVTVFLSGAEVTRTVRLNLTKGEHTVVFSDLPAETVAGSVRVDGKATAKLDIQSVDARRRYVARADQAAVQTERKRIEDEIERLRDERGLAQGAQDAAQTQKTLLSNLAALPGHTGDDPQTQPAVPRTDWTQILALIGTGMADAQRASLDAEVKKRDFDRKIEDMEKQLSALAPARTEQTEIKVFVVADATLDADLTVRYQVRNASWLPRYDARLTTGSRTAPPKLELTRRAEIKQRTGEAWEGVELRLSTAGPASNAAAPDLNTVTVDFEADIPKPVAVSNSDAAGEGVPASGKFKVARELRAAAAPAAPAPALEIAEQRAAVTTAPFQAVFQVPGSLSIPDTGEAKRVLLQQDTVEPTLTIRTVPKVDAKAYLYAKLVLPKGSPLLPGEVSLFRDGTFVGTGDLPVMSPGEEHQVGFGSDDQVRVRHAIAEDKRGETGLISSARTDSRNFRITVKNMHERAVDLVVQDQIPVSQNQDIRVELVGPTAPTRKDIEDRRGVLAFESKLEPEEERVIEFGYRVIWPGARTIVYQ